MGHMGFPDGMGLTTAEVRSRFTDSQERQFIRPYMRNLFVNPDDPNPVTVGFDSVYWYRVDDIDQIPVGTPPSDILVYRGRLYKRSTRRHSFEKKDGQIVQRVREKPEARRPPVSLVPVKPCGVAAVLGALLPVACVIAEMLM